MVSVFTGPNPANTPGFGAPPPVAPTEQDTTTAAPEPVPAMSGPIDLLKQSNDDLLGKIDLSKQSNDQLLGEEPSTFQAVKSAIPYFLGGGGVQGDVARDQFFHGTAVGRVMDALGQGFSDGWGSEPVGMSEETRKWLSDAGIITGKDDSAWSKPFKAFNEGILRQGATLWDLASRLPGAAISGTAEYYGQIAQELGASPTTASEIEKTINLLPFAMGDAAISTPHSPEVPRAVERAPEAVTEAKPPESPAVPTEVAPTLVESAGIKSDLAEKGTEPQVPTAVPEVQPKPLTLDEIATRANPALMDQWRSLVTRRDTYRQWIDDLNGQRKAQAEADSPHTVELNAVKGEIDDLNARISDATPRLAKKYNARLDDLNSRAEQLQQAHNDYVSETMARESPDIAQVRRALMQNDYRMRDLAPQVSDAYKAARQVAHVEPEAVAPEAPQAHPEAAPEPPVAEQMPIAEGKPAEVAPESIQPERKAQEAAAPTQAPAVGHTERIADDVRQKLIKAGRSEEEAKAIAPIIAAHYEARASRFQGKTPLDLYEAEAPEIKTGRATTKRGTAKLVEGQRPVIRLMQDADPSTFLHETGHVWLSELMQDAKAQGVHQSVIDDAQAVRQWLGNDGGDITRGQHEQFARAFEDYLYTGDAPTARLAGMFEQIRDWMTKLYQAARRTAIQVPDSIRDVFDRLITANPERQPMDLPKETFGKGLADLHEVDAEHSPGEIASEVGHNVEGDLGRTADERPPLGEDVDRGIERGSRSGAENAGEPSAAGIEAGDNGRGGKGNAPASSEISGSARETETEGARSRGGEAAVDHEREEGETATLTKPTARTEVPADPNAKFDPAPMPEQYFDKAGNIRLDNLNRPEDIKQVLRISAIENAGFMEQRGGVIPLLEQQSAADALGLTPENFTANRPIDIPESTWLRAVKDLTLRSATDVRDLMVKAKNSGSDADAATLGKALARHQMIQGEFSRAKAESGRALAANRWDDAKAMVEGVGRMAEQATGMTLNQLKAMARDGAVLDTPAKVSKFVNDAMAPTMRDKIQYVALNGLISGPITHMTYMAANMLTAIFKVTAENALSAAAGTVRDAIGGGAESRVHWQEIPASAYGMFKGARDGVRAAAQAWRENMTSPLPGEDIEKFYSQHVRVNPIGGTLGTVVGVPGRMVGALDAFSRRVFYSMNIAEQAARQAMDEGLVGNSRAQRTAELTKTPTPEMMDRAIKFATSMAYMEKPEYGSAMYHIERFANSNLATKMMLPFVRTGANIIDQAFVERTPIGILSQQVRDDLLGRNGPVAADIARGRMAAGILVGAALTGLAVEGLATGAGPKDPNERRLWLVDHQPYSLRIGNTWVQYKRLGHIGLLMGMGANIAESIHALNEEGASAAVLQLANGVATDVVDESWMAGLQNVLNLIEDPQRAKAAPFSFASELIPFSSLLRQSANALDPYMRAPSDMEDRFKNIVPGLRETLPPRRDVWGEPVPSAQAPFFALAMSPFQDRIHDDPVNDQLLELGVYPALPDRKISGVELTRQQYDDYTRVAGRLKKAAVNSVMRSPGWSTLPDVVKVQTLRSVFEGANKSAKGAILLQYPAIIQQAQQLHLQQLH